MERAFFLVHGLDDDPSPGNTHLDGGIQVDAHFLQQVCRNGHQDTFYDFVVRFLHISFLVPVHKTPDTAAFLRKQADGR